MNLFPEKNTCLVDNIKSTFFFFFNQCILHFFSVVQRHMQKLWYMCYNTLIDKWFLPIQYLQTTRFSVKKTVLKLFFFLLSFFKKLTAIYCFYLISFTILLIFDRKLFFFFVVKSSMLYQICETIKTKFAKITLMGYGITLNPL